MSSRSCKSGSFFCLHIISQSSNLHRYSIENDELPRTISLFEHSTIDSNDSRTSSRTATIDWKWREKEEKCNSRSYADDRDAMRPVIVVRREPRRKTSNRFDRWSFLGTGCQCSFDSNTNTSAWCRLSSSEIPWWSWSWCERIFSPSGDPDELNIIFLCFS